MPSHHTLRAATAALAFIALLATLRVDAAAGDGRLRQQHLDSRDAVCAADADYRATNRHLRVDVAARVTWLESDRVWVYVARPRATPTSGEAGTSSGGTPAAGHDADTSAATTDKAASKVVAAGGGGAGADTREGDEATGGGAGGGPRLSLTALALMGLAATVRALHRAVIVRMRWPRIVATRSRCLPACSCGHHPGGDGRCRFRHECVGVCTRR